MHEKDKSRKQRERLKVEKVVLINHHLFLKNL